MITVAYELQDNMKCIIIKCLYAVIMGALLRGKKEERNGACYFTMNLTQFEWLN